MSRIIHHHHHETQPYDEYVTIEKPTCELRWNSGFNPPRLEQKFTIEEQGTTRIGEEWRLVPDYH